MLGQSRTEETGASSSVSRTSRSPRSTSSSEIRSKGRSSSAEKVRDEFVLAQHLRTPTTNKFADCLKTHVARSRAPTALERLIPSRGKAKKLLTTVGWMVQRSFSKRLFRVIEGSLSLVKIYTCNRCLEERRWVEIDVMIRCIITL